MNLSVIEVTGADVFLAALAYYDAGISVIPVQGKLPSLLPGGERLRWHPFQTRRAPRSAIHTWQNMRLLAGVAVICGAVSGNLAVIDLDGDEAIERFELAFPALTKTFTVRSGSGHGEHLYFQCGRLPETTRAKGYELRATGCYVVAPPSPHPSGGRYTVQRLLPVASVSDLDDVAAWIRSQRQPTAAPTRSTGITNSTAYGAGALRTMAARVESAGVGVRNTELNICAFKLGKLAARGHVSQAEVERVLLTAALNTGLDERESAKTIASGFTAGLRAYP